MVTKFEQQLAKSTADTAGSYSSPEFVKKNITVYATVGDVHIQNISIDNSTIETGHDLTLPDTLLLIEFSDIGGTARPWPIATLKPSNMVREGTDFSYIWNYDNDYITLRVVDAEKGIITFVDAGRQVLYRSSELIQKTKIIAITDES